MENDIFHYFVERGWGRERWWDPQVFSPPPSKYNLSKLERKLEWKVGKIFWQNYPHLFFTFLAPFFFFFLFYFYFVSLAFCFFFFFLSLVLSGGGVLLLLFLLFFFLNFYFYYFFKKTLLDDFLCYFSKRPLSSIQFFF